MLLHEALSMMMMMMMIMMMRKKMMMKAYLVSAALAGYKGPPYQVKTSYEDPKDCKVCDI